MVDYEKVSLFFSFFFFFFSSSELISLFSQEKPDPHTVASLFKMWLREMPNPLLTSERYDDFIQVSFNPHSIYYYE